jgi:hypothetical protein
MTDITGTQADHLQEFALELASYRQARARIRPGAEGGSELYVQLFRAMTLGQALIPAPDPDHEGRVLFVWADNRQPIAGEGIPAQAATVIRVLEGIADAPAGQ